MLNGDAQCSHAAVTEPLKVCLAREKKSFWVDGCAQLVLVTGGAGYIGWRHLSPPLVDC